VGFPVKTFKSEFNKYDNHVCYESNTVGHKPIPSNKYWWNSSTVLTIDKENNEVSGKQVVQERIFNERNSVVQETVVNLSRRNGENKLECSKTKKTNSRNYLLTHGTFDQHRKQSLNEYEQMFDNICFNRN